MKRAYAILLAIGLLLAGCGDGEGTDTTISTREAPAPEEAQTDQTPPPETTPERSPDTTAPLASPTTAASGGYDYDYGAPSDGGTSTETTAAGDEGEDGAQAGATVEASNTDLGRILVGPDGMTLYVFLPDDQSESTCYDACAATWPPLEDELAAGAGVDEAMLGSVERTDGTVQATYNGWPLYYYASDSEPGDVMGQGVGDNWFVVDPAGEVVDG